MGEWKKVKLGDCIEVKYGKDHKKLQEGNIPCYGSGGLMRYVDEKLYNKPSILIPRKGSLNNIMYQDKSFWTVDTMFWSKIDEETVFPKFLFYQLTLIDYTVLNVGSAVPSLTVPVINEIDIKLPPLPEQKAIAEVLSSLDDKIDLLHRQNKTLEQMAETLFRQWFVEESKEDWKERNLGEFFPVVTGKKDANYGSESGQYPFFTCSKKQTLFTENYSFEGDAILLTGNGDFSVKWYRGKFEAYQRTYVLIPYEPMLLPILHVLVQFFLNNLTKGHRGSVINYLTKSMITDFSVLLPNNDILTEKSTEFLVIYKKSEAVLQQIRILEKMRDTLLPKLMSGEVRVSYE